MAHVGLSLDGRVKQAHTGRAFRKAGYPGEVGPWGRMVMGKAQAVELDRPMGKPQVAPCCKSVSLSIGWVNIVPFCERVVKIKSNDAWETSPDTTAS